MMKKVLLVASILLAVIGCKSGDSHAGSTGNSASASTVADPEHFPVFDFAETSYDFGTITSGEKVTHEFKFKNVGKKPLIISDAVASCGCTVPEKPDHPIAPGAEGVIKVIFDSTDKLGKQHKVVTLTSNTNPAKTEIFLEGEVEEASK